MYQDFKKNHDDSKYNDFFIRWEKFWEAAGKDRPTQKDIDMIYKRKDKAPEQEIDFDDGSKEHHGYQRRTLVRSRSEIRRANAVSGRSHRYHNTSHIRFMAWS